MTDTHKFIFGGRSGFSSTGIPPVCESSSPVASSVLCGSAASRCLPFLKPSTPIPSMKKLRSILCLITLLAAFGFLVSAAAQSAVPTSPLYAGLSQVLDLNDTNSLVNADEVNLTPQFKWNSATSEAGGAINIDWWAISDQQGAFFGFEEYSSRASYFSLGYQARTVFKGLEISLGVGTRQSNADPIGDVQMFIRPTLTKQLYASANWDIRLALGADVMNQGKPNPFLGVTFRALKF